MKNLMMAGLLIFVSALTYGQNVKHDPTYSVNNYKHPNKAADARKFNPDSVTNLESFKLSGNDNYKQPFNKTFTKKSFIVVEAKDNKKANSSKHPYGL